MQKWSVNFCQVSAIPRYPPHQEEDQGKKSRMTLLQNSSRSSDCSDCQAAWSPWGSFPGGVLPFSSSKLLALVPELVCSCRVQCCTTRFLSLKQVLFLALSQFWVCLSAPSFHQILFGLTASLFTSSSFPLPVSSGSRSSVFPFPKLLYLRCSFPSF